MRTGSKQKLKYVINLEILRQETDADHPMQTNTLLKKLEEQGIECSRETLYSDIKALNENMEEYVLEATELLARAICHETEHLDGIMFTSHVEGDLIDVTEEYEETED